MSNARWRTQYYAFMIGAYNGVIHGIWPGLPISIAIVVGSFLFGSIMEKVNQP